MLAVHLFQAGWNLLDVFTAVHRVQTNNQLKSV